MKPDRFQGKSKGAVVGFGGDAKGVADDVVDFDIFYAIVSGTVMVASIRNRNSGASGGA